MVSAALTARSPLLAITTTIRQHLFAIAQPPAERDCCKDQVQCDASAHEEVGLANGACCALRATRRLARKEDGAAAVEFGLVAAPFLLLVFAIMETAIVFFAGQALETAVADSARLIMTGQAQTQGFNQSAFKNAVCARIYGLFDCANGVYVDVKTYTDLQQCRPQPAARRERQLPEQPDLSARRARRHRGGAPVLSMADLRVAARSEHVRQQAPPDRDRRVPQRAVSARSPPPPECCHERSFVPDQAVANVRSLRRDQRGVSAVEFAMLLPLMMTLYLGTVEISQGVASTAR